MVKNTKSQSQLEQFVDEIARLTGLSVCVYDLSYFTQESAHLAVPHRMRIHCSAFCEKIKSDPEAWEKCIETQYFRAEEAARRDEPFLHTCHAGITDLVLALRVNRHQIGALYLGQAVTQTARSHQSTLRQTATQFGFDLQELKTLSAQRPHLSPAQLQSYGTLLQLLKAYIEQAEALSDLERDSGAFLTRGSRGGQGVLLEHVPTILLDRLRPRSAAIARAVQIIRNGYWQNLRLPDVARQVRLSQSHFSRQFQRETGLGFRRCLLQTRLDVAAYLLKKTDLSPKEIAHLLGYSDPTSFLRAFKAHMHYTPHEFLRRQPPPAQRDRPW